MRPVATSLVSATTAHRDAGRARPTLAAARAVLAYLNRGRDLVLVATHDIEVIDVLDGAYDAHHFREQIAGCSMTFDYRIHPGASSTRNAIAMLELLEYPADLVADALATIDWQSRREEY